MSSRKRIAVVGAGPKGIALASKAYVLRQQGIADIDVVLYDEADVAANWDGEHGLTDGNQKLGTPPDKDVGFPYKSIFGYENDRELMRLSWNNYLVAKGKFSGYVDRGKPNPTHKIWAKYLRWVLEEIGQQAILSKVIGFDISSNDGLLIVSSRSSDDDIVEKSKFDGIVFTGPGEPTKIVGSKHDWNESIIDGRQFWQRIPVFQSMAGKNKKIAVIGGGETAASIVVSLIENAQGLSIDIINRHGTLYTRGESYHENELYTDPEQWKSLSEADREDFIRRTDRGVFSVESKKTIDHAESIKIITGNVQEISKKGSMVSVTVHRGTGQNHFYSYDKVIIATGFDPLSPLDMLPAHKRNKQVITPSGEKSDVFKFLRKEVDYHLRVPMPFDLKIKKKVHMPMLSAFAQGPGLPNLSCLGVFSDRVLSAYISEEMKEKYINKEDLEMVRYESNDL